MAKHPVPHQRLADSRGNRRYKTFANKARKKLSNKTNIVDCPSCGEKALAHHVCEACGKYRDIEVINKKKGEDKITKIKA